MNSQAEFISRPTDAITEEYSHWIVDLKKRYKQAQIRASVKVNNELLQFYWSFGQDIVKLQADSVWGSGFLKRLSLDLQHDFPHNSGLSYSNLKYARQWYLFYYEHITKSPQVVGFLECQTTDPLSMPALFTRVPWGHHREIIAKIKDIHAALFYLQKVATENLSRSVLLHCIENHLYEHTGQAITNFDQTLSLPQSALAQDFLKSPYNLDFLALSSSYDEREFEDQLARHITDFLLELGSGFAYVGRQKELVLPSGKSYRPDMIFYHIPLHCYVVVELKVVEFEPEFAGKLNFYVSAVDELLKSKNDNPTIGLLICKSKDDTVVQWAFRGIERPLGVANYENEIKKIETILPSIDDIKRNI